LFIALTDQRDGHDFVAAALNKGAAAAMVSRHPDGVAADAPLLMVGDVLAGLTALGAAGRARFGGRLAAITGSVGKTSTKEMLAAMLTDQGRTHASVASYNNHWGVPLTLARMPQDTEFAIIEIGMNHPGEIAPLARLARPHVAMVTTVAPAHLEAFENVEEIAVEKASIFEGLEYAGVAVMNNDIDQAAILAAKAHDCKRRDIGFGVHGFDFVLEKVDVQGATTVVQARAHDAPLLFKLATPGRHFAMNALGALAVVESLGADIARAAISLGQWTPYAGRGARETIYLDLVEPDQTLDLIDDSYNANPASMAAALDVLAGSQPRREMGGRRIAFLGDMKELGPDAVALHAGLAHLEASKAVDVIHCVGPLMKALHDLLPDHQRGTWTETAPQMLDHLHRKLHSGDVVLAKGSLSMGLGQIVDAIRKMGHPAPES
jgi:UDP-N-acetylmuramoyl-tripeptide--D-alanyl-D-alanine ligase